MVESNQDEVHPARRSWCDTATWKPNPNKLWHSSEWTALGRPGASLFDPRPDPQSPLVSWSGTSEASVSGNPFSLELIIKEIDNEFRHMKGEPVYTFGRQPTPGLETIRDAIKGHAKALIERIDMLEAQLDTEENRKALAKKKIRETISEGRKEALECRIKTIENILVEYLPIA